MEHSDADLRRILRATKTVACVGVSPRDTRPSYFVFRFLHLRGYRVIPVNPGHAGKEMFGQRIYGELSEIPDPGRVDMLDVFRRAEFVPEVYAAAKRHLTGLRTLWLQIGVRNDAVASQARADGLEVVQDRCPKMEYQRLFGELRKAGINTGVISSKL